MGKKSKEKTGDELPDHVLPQNILLVGERVEEDKNIYISQPVYKEIHKFTQNKTTNESGGILVGTVIEAFGKTNLVISGFIEAKYTESTPTTLKFTHETWDYVHKEIEKRYSDKKILGWIHTHPDFGIFLSEYDKFIQQNFFSEEDQVAYVVDPIQKIEGFYFWINGRIEKCKGFYIYDQTGVKLAAGLEASEPAPAGRNHWLTPVLAAAVAVLIVLQIFTQIRLEGLQKQQELILSSANQSLIYLQEQLDFQNAEIEKLKDPQGGEKMDSSPSEPEATPSQAKDKENL